MNEPRPILIVEDDPLLSAALSEVFERGGYPVAAAGNGFEALERLRAGDHRPGVILLDLVMPDMDGWELCNKLAADPTLQAVPIVLLSAAWNLHSERTRCVHAAARLLKPINFKRLLEVVERLCGPAMPARGAETSTPPRSKRLG